MHVTFPAVGGILLRSFIILSLTLCMHFGTVFAQELVKASLRDDRPLSNELSDVARAFPDSTPTDLSPTAPLRVVFPTGTIPDDLHGPTIGPIKKGRIYLVGGAMLAGNTAIMYYYYKTFYSPRQSERSSWHVFNDWYNADLNVDKIGHIWGTQAYANTLYHLFRWTNMREEPAMWWSSGLALFFQTEMEMTDAFYKAWGWSWWDVGANVIGAAYPNLQRAWPPLSSVCLKMSYRPSRLITQKWVDYVLKDYDGFTFWLALTVEDVLPAGLKRFWPDWLGIAVGYGAANTVIAKNTYNTDRNNIGLGDQEWYIALDYDLRRLPGDSPLLKFLKEELNLLHFPSPAIRITPSAVFYGFFF
ncbi:MAG: DUF2279 domain-containing protein [Bacteroidota bacterium]|nr:DUF2279 domain-containing protein [Bacteroidota bacterium]